MLTGLRVLVVDDHADSRDVLEQTLGFHHATVTTVGTAEQALPLMAGADVVVTDMVLPGQDGVWLLEQVSRLPQPVPVIAVTGIADIHNARLAAAPFARKLLKPVDPFSVANEILGVVRGRA